MLRGGRCHWSAWGASRDIEDRVWHGMGTGCKYDYNGARKTVRMTVQVRLPVCRISALRSGCR